MVTLITTYRSDGLALANPATRDLCDRNVAIDPDASCAVDWTTHDLNQISDDATAAGSKRLLMAAIDLRRVIRHHQSIRPIGGHWENRRCAVVNARESCSNVLRLDTLSRITLHAGLTNAHSRHNHGMHAEDGIARLQMDAQHAVPGDPQRYPI